jgi:NAD(P)-dependent dehydrogenase (short-subunit alcohol dehydrogenase family)
VGAAVRTAIVTGAASGLGRALALRLAKDGWQLALADVDTERAHETLAMVEKAGGSGQVELLDVADQTAWAALVERLRNQWPQLDLLVNNAGVCGAGDVGDFPLADWQWLLGVNLHGVIYGCHTCLPWLKQNPSGAHIINTASIAAFLAAPTMGAYNVAKAGVLALSETMYAELAPQGISVTVVCPGFFQSGLLEKGRFMQEFGRELAADYMRKSTFTADHVADAAVKAMHRKKFYVVEGRRARWLWRVKRSIPLGFLKLVSSGWKKTQDQQRAKKGG